MVIHQEREPVGLEDEIKNLLDKELDKEKLGQKGDLREEAIKLFQQLFVEKLNFDVVTGTLTGVAEEIPTDDWSKSSKAKKAFMLAEALNFRVLYIELESMTRTTERHAVSTMRAQGWAREKEFIAIFYEEGSDIWHLVSPYEEEGEGRTVLRRYVIGKGETHRTVSRNLAKMDVERTEALYDRVQEAFRLQPVTKEFYEDYKEVYKKLYDSLKDMGLEIREAKRYAHLTLNRLMFIYFIQKKNWLPNGKNFMSWFFKEYSESDDENCFYEKWLSALFFEAMNTPEGTSIEDEFPEEVEEALISFPFLNGGLFEKKDIDERDIHFDDRILNYAIKGFLEEYNFTVKEETPFDVNVAVDPAMLGKIYESLIAEEERGKSGIFYTPRVEVDLMCRLALFEHLLTKATDPDKKGKKEIIDFLFTPIEKWEKDVKDVENLMDILHDVKVVDPACGSGAFLVGMMQVFNELYRKLGENPGYEFRERIVHENLHGVDIKDWAVRMAEFRLWLALVENEEEVPDVEPVLPNFDFKLKIGDSIVQKIGQEYISLDEVLREAEGGIEEKIDELMELKTRYFKGESKIKDRIEETQKELIKKHLENKIQSLRNKMNKNQVTLSGEMTEEAKEKKEKLKEEIKKLQETIEKFKKVYERDEKENNGFFWDLDFTEVMLNKGFDIVIGNPPYVRGREIIPQSYGPDQLEAMPSNQVQTLRDKYKNDLQNYVKNKFDLKPYKTSDLYLHFFFKGFELLKPKGTLTYITSNSWLNTKFGKRLQEGFLRYTTPEFIFDNRSARTFADSDINTVITVAKKSKTSQLSGGCSFVSVNISYSKFNNPNILKNLLVEKSNKYEIEFQNTYPKVEERRHYRSVEVTTRDLWSLGDGTIGTHLTQEELSENNVPKGAYSGSRWVIFHRAPDIYFEILNQSGSQFKELQEYVSEIKTGAYTGLNDFYYFETDRGKEFKERIDDEFLLPVIRDPEQVQHCEFNPNNLDTYVFVCRKTKKELNREGYKSALEYINWGEKQERDDGTSWPEVPSIKDRNPGWWALPKKDSKPTNFFVGYVIDKRFVSTFAKQKITSDRCFHRIYGESSRLRKVQALFCSSLAPFLIELTGTANLGQGALKFETRLLKQLPFLDPDIVDLEMIKKPLSNLKNREIENIFVELGANKLEEFELENVKDDLRAIDEYVLGELIGLSEAKQVELYKEIIKMVRNRIEKAESV